MALGDTIYLYLYQGVTGYGSKGTTVGPLTETVQTEAMVTNGLALVVAGPGVVPPVAPAPTDGQVPVWSASLGQWVPANPTGASELAAAENITAVTQTIVGVANTISAVTTITGTAISVPASGGRPVTFHYGAAISQSVAGDGSWYLNIQETTAGNVTIGGKAVRLPNSTAASTDVLGIDGEFPIGVVASTRQFRLIGFLWCPAANTPQVVIANAATTPSYLRAVAG